MELRNYSIVKRILITQKSNALYAKQGKMTFEVARDANKVEIRKAIEAIWNVKVDTVNVINTPERTGTFGRRRFVRPGIKKAIVALKEGYKIEMPGQYESVGDASSEG